jgi:MoaA/NifB/PqqE/SkfB family radical SAM enzyme
MEKIKIRKITGARKAIKNLYIKLVTFLYFLWRLVAGEIKPRYFLRFLKRLLFFLSHMHHNKYVKIGKYTKIALYVPAFPSKAFFAACRKLLEFKNKMPCITALVSMTSACRFRCQHCYQRFDKGKDVDIEKVVQVVKGLQDKGLAFFNIEGGDPFIIFDRLKKLCEAIDNRSEILINSTGDGMTYDRLAELKKHKNIIGIMFSLHTYKPEILNEFMGRDDAWDTLINGINLCHEVSIPVTFNCCLNRNEFYDGTFEKVMDLAKDLNGAILQLIKPKPAGGWLESGAGFFSEEDLEHIKKKVHMYNLDKKYKEFPYIAAMIIDEGKSMFGCTSGGTDRFYINAKGDVQPCEFLNISFGNIQTENFDDIFNKMREQFKVPGDCWLCEKYSGEILKLYKEHNLKTLPLPLDISEEIYKNWDRGEPAGFYKKVVEL